MILGGASRAGRQGLQRLTLTLLLASFGGTIGRRPAGHGLRVFLGRTRCDLLSHCGRELDVRVCTSKHFISNLQKLVEEFGFATRIRTHDTVAVQLRRRRDRSRRHFRWARGRSGVLVCCGVLWSGARFSNTNRSVYRQYKFTDAVHDIVNWAFVVCTL